MARLFLIAGHGAGDSGAVGNGYTEAERVRTLAFRIKKLGGDKVLLGDTNRNYYADNGISSLDIPKDCQILELHMDSGVASAHGGHVIIHGNYSPDAYDQALAAMLAEILPGRANMIVGRTDLANVKRAAAKGYSYRLVEFGFISNANDVKIFNSRMDEIAKGVLKSFGISVAEDEPPLPKQIPGNPINDMLLYYRAHCQGVGWLDPVRDGQTAGTVGFSKRLEAIMIDLRKIREKYPDAKLSAKVHIQGIGWVFYDNVEHDTVLGTVGQGKRLEAIELELTGVPGKNIYVQTHLAKYGWTGYIAGGYTSGTVGIGTAVQAMRLKVA